MAYLYRQMTPADEDEVRQLYNQFFRSETLSQAMCLEVPRECQKFVEYAMAQCLYNGVSSVAVDTKTSKLVGMNVCIIATESNDQNWVYPDNNADCNTIKRLFGILDKLAITDNYFKLYDVKNILLSRGMVVYPEYQRQGIGFNMLKTSVELARRLGIGMVIMDCTGVYSAKIMDRFGFERVNEIKFAEHKGDGPFYLPEDDINQSATLDVLKI